MNGKCEAFKKIHTHNVFFWNMMITACLRGRNLEGAQFIFDRMPQQDLVSWNTMIAAYAKRENDKEALKLFREMNTQSVAPDKFTFTAVLIACSGLAALAEGKRLHNIILYNKIGSDIYISNALISMYGRCGCIEDAKIVFNKMCHYDVVSWTAMMAAYAQNDNSKAAYWHFEKMMQEGFVPNKVTFLTILDACANMGELAKGKRIHSLITASLRLDIMVGSALINMYGKYGCSADVKIVFDQLNHQDVILWNSMLVAYSQNGQGIEAFHCFEEMDRLGIVADEFVYATILDASAGIASLANGKFLHDRIVQNGLESNVVVASALIDMYGKCGNLEDAQLVFNKLPECGIVTWSAMLAAYAQNGDGTGAFQTFQAMQQHNVCPNDVSVLNVMLACSHAGIIDEGCHVFGSISQDHCISLTLEHWHCMVDMFARAGGLDIAENLIYNMGFESLCNSWTPLLGACKSHGEADLSVLR